MAYDERLAARVRAALDGRRVVEKKMMGGLVFMVNGKMCVGIHKDLLMARIDPQRHDGALATQGCRPMDITGRPMRGFVFVDRAGTGSASGLKYWVALALDFNKKAKASKK